uniref:Uncharacterized protein n=1 Tax=Acrobeloides nanus TaxID=290746 RepID=A0A914CHF2_9BILA
MKLVFTLLLLSFLLNLHPTEAGCMNCAANDCCRGEITVFGIKMSYGYCCSQGRKRRDLSLLEQLRNSKMNKEQQNENGHEAFI